jgi:ADP-ribose pyrophosphatase YjhB (NUDIX family)
MEYNKWSAGVIITNPSKTLFYLQQKDETYYVEEYRLKHCFFGGGVKKNELVLDAMKREIKEELDLKYAGLIIKNLKMLFDSYFTNIQGITYKFTIFESILDDDKLKDLSRYQPKEGKQGVLLNKEEFRNIPFFTDLEETRIKYLSSLE